MGKLDNIKTFSIKNFIADLPRMLNESFNALKDAIGSFYTENGQTTTISATNVTADGIVEANTVIASQYATKSGAILNLDEIDDRLDAMDASIASKVDAVEGKQLSTNDYTDEEKQKVASIDSSAVEDIYEQLETVTETAEDASARSADAYSIAEDAKASVDGKANDASVIHNTGDETIEGVKTFSWGIDMGWSAVKRLKTPEDDGDAVTKEYVDASISTVTSEADAALKSAAKAGEAAADASARIGNLDELTTTSKDSAVSAINEVNGSVESVKSSLDGKQATLVSGTNIKTINDQSILGSGNIVIEGPTVNVIDGLDSSSATDALSANQGRILNEKISAIDSSTSPFENGTGSNSAIQKNMGDDAPAEGAIAFGHATKAKGKYAYAEGDNTISSGGCGHTEGSYTNANGFCAHAEGQVTSAYGGSSHAEGFNTVTRNLGEHAEGAWNISHIKEDGTDEENRAKSTRHSIGIGTKDKKMNAVEIMKNGDNYVYGLGGFDGTNAGTDGVLPIQDVVDIKQDALVSGTNIKTINNQSILGSGNITIEGGGAAITVVDHLESTSTTDALSANQGRVLNGKIAALDSSSIPYSGSIPGENVFAAVEMLAKYKASTSQVDTLESSLKDKASKDELIDGLATKLNASEISSYRTSADQDIIDAAKADNVSVVHTSGDESVLGTKTFGSTGSVIISEDGLTTDGGDVSIGEFTNVVVNSTPVFFKSAIIYEDESDGTTTYDLQEVSKKAYGAVRFDDDSQATTLTAKQKETARKNIGVYSKAEVDAMIAAIKLQLGIN